MPRFAAIHDALSGRIGSAWSWARRRQPAPDPLAQTLLATDALRAEDGADSVPGDREAPHRVSLPPTPRQVTIGVHGDNIALTAGLYAAIERLMVDVYPDEWLRPRVYVATGSADYLRKNNLDLLIRCDGGGSGQALTAAALLDAVACRGKSRCDADAVARQVGQNRLSSFGATIDQGWNRRDAWTPEATARLPAGAGVKPIVHHVLGGVGPLAGAVLLERYAQRATDAGVADFVDVQLYSNPTAHRPWLQRLFHPLGHSRRGLRPYAKNLNRFLRSAERNEVAPPSFAIASNTAHKYAASYARSYGAELIHMIDETAKRATIRRSDGTVGVLATTTTRHSGMYEDSFRRVGPGEDALEWPTDDEQTKVQHAIDAIKAGQIDAGRRELSTVLDAMEDRGVTTLVLACTELPLAFGEGALRPFEVIDTVNVLADAMVAYDRKRLANLGLTGTVQPEP